MAKLQFQNHDEIKAALQPGVIYWQVYFKYGLTEPETVIRQDEHSSKLGTVILYTDKYGSGYRYLDDMQNCEGKAVFTDYEMAVVFATQTIENLT